MWIINKYRLKTHATSNHIHTHIQIVCKCSKHNIIVHRIVVIPDSHYYVQLWSYQSVSSHPPATAIFDYRHPNAGNKHNFISSWTWTWFLPFTLAPSPAANSIIRLIQQSIVFTLS
eukprot:213473_1